VSRLEYKPIAHDDLPLFAEFMADPDSTRYLIVPRAHTYAESAALLDRWVAQHDGELGMYTLMLGGETVGWAGFVRRALRWGDEVELGWSIRPPHRGQGYATEAALALRPRGPERVVHLIHPDNARSIQVATRLGATVERTMTIRGNPVAVYVSPRETPQAAESATARPGIYE
jgi:RimJ/RimL family protein N-acetyltransferase